MDQPAGSRASLSDYLAAERTLLAWIRTGVALMGLGFVVARFGLFLEEFESTQHSLLPPPSHGLSPWFGAALIVVGVFVNVIAGWRHARLTRELDRGETAHSHPSSQAVGIAFFVAAAGLAIVISLVWVRTANRSLESSKEMTMRFSEDRGISGIPSHHSVDETVARLKGLLEGQGATLFAVIDHSGEAQKVGMTMPPTKLLIFGSPRAGTPVMLAAPSIAIDLPLKVLVWQDSDEKVWVSYNSVVYLQERHRVPKDLLPNIGVVETLAAKAAE
jgi:uncharacterized protein (DUF302 family)/uncharacterized membrane protein YidH (DUF202 family)